jgi:hypothetical protein
MRVNVVRITLALLLSLPLTGSAIALGQSPRARLGDPIPVTEGAGQIAPEKPTPRTLPQEALPVPPLVSNSSGNLVTDSALGDLYHQVGGCLQQLPAPALPGRIWIDGEGLLWSLRSSPVPVLATGSVPGTTLANAGVVGNKTTTILYGTTTIDYGPTAGGRFSLGYWLNDQQTFGIAADGFFLTRRTRDFAASSDSTGNPILARPFISTVTGKESAEVVAFPGTLTGHVAVASNAELWGTEAIVLGPILVEDGYRIQWLGGMRYVNMNEALDISQTSTALIKGTLGFGGVPLAKGNTLTILDSFGTRNQFFGGEFGVRCTLPFGKFSVDWGGTVALGSTREAVNIVGSTTLTTPTSQSTLPGGLLALPTNMGKHVRYAPAALLEGQLKFKYHLTERLYLGFGYDVLWWNDVVRPGSQIDRTVDPRQIPSSLQFSATATTTRPSFFFNQSDFWVHGFLFEVGFKF